MALPQVVIVGRPNVGKSSILNWIAGKLVSVVDPTAGVTRDRVTYVASHPDESGEDRYFTLVDTGGMGVVDVDDLSEDVEHQIDVAVESADLVLFVVDARTGPLPLDEMVAERVRKLSKPTLLVVNKADSEKAADEVPAFFRLGTFPHVTTSVKGNRGRRGLLDELVRMLPEAGEVSDSETADPTLKLAVVGRRNVGKSTFLNALAGEDRMIVSEVAGTTRDSVDVRFEKDGRVFVAIDTPGVRKKKSLANDIEFYGLVRAQKSVRRADVVLLFFDATQTISKVDKQLMEFIGEQDVPCVFVVNKWDLGLEAKMTTERWAEYFTKTFATLSHVPVAFITAMTGKNVWKLIDLAESLHKQSHERVSTGALNRVVEQAYDRNPPPYAGNRRGKIFYATQVAVGPPTIVLKVNEAKLFQPNWKRYLLSCLRDELPYDEVPIKVLYRGRGREEE